VEKIELEIVGLSSSQSQSGSFALVLGEIEGKRRLPIIIGMFEAQAIAVELEQIPPKRPMTHDLFKSLASSFSLDLKEVYISSLKEGVFFANLLSTDGSKEAEIDTRPSDAIALALRFNVPIYTNEQIMSEAAIVIEEEEDDADEFVELDEEDDLVMELDAKAEVSMDNLGEFDSQQLNLMLEDAINDEDYEKAAKLRDEIQKRTS
jgi:bifunctional DNase/RNase